MPHRDTANLIGELYEAATGMHDWLTVSRSLCDLLEAEGASLSVALGNATPHNLLRPDDASETAYVNFYRKIDPIRAAAARLLLPQAQQGIRTERELVPEADYLRSEFYQDFARHANQRYMMVAAVGDFDNTMLAFFRGDRRDPFSGPDRDLVTGFIPHLRRALQLRRRLMVDGVGADAGLAALERSRSGHVIVDPGMRILFANEVSVRIAESPSSGLLIRRWGPRPDPGSTILAARHRKDNLALKEFVANVAKGGAGGALRLHSGEEANDNSASSIAAIVSPVPARLASQRTASAMSGIAARQAMIMLHDLAKPIAPPAALFRDLFGLSAAEAAVAVALLGGKTAEDVAHMRQVSLDTVRSQIRTVLNKSEATNLRDLERIGAMLGSMAGS